MQMGDEEAQNVFETRCFGIRDEPEPKRKLVTVKVYLHIFTRKESLPTDDEKDELREISSAVRVETNFLCVRLSVYVISSNWNFCSMNILHMIAFIRRKPREKNEKFIAKMATHLLIQSYAQLPFKRHKWNS